jgi:hypothetical protein
LSLLKFVESADLLKKFAARIDKRNFPPSDCSDLLTGICDYMLSFVSSYYTLMSSNWLTPYKGWELSRINLCGDLVYIGSKENFLVLIDFVVLKSSFGLI